MPMPTTNTGLGTHFITWPIKQIEEAKKRSPSRVFVVLKVDFKNPMQSIVNMYHEMEGCV